LQAQLKGTVEGHVRLFFGGACLITGMLFLAEYLKTQDSILNELIQLEDTVRVSIAKSLWQYNQNQLDALVVSLVTMPVIEGVNILDKYAKNMLSKRSYTPATEALSVFDRKSDLYWSLNKEERFLGSLTLY
jgi:hypothetical protein